MTILHFFLHFLHLRGRNEITLVFADDLVSLEESKRTGMISLDIVKTPFMALKKTRYVRIQTTKSDN